MINRTRLAAVVSLAATLLGTTAAAHATDVRPMVKAAADFGGDTLVTVIFTDGSQQSIKANELLSLGRRRVDRQRGRRHRGGGLALV